MSTPIPEPPDDTPEIDLLKKNLAELQSIEDSLRRRIDQLNEEVTLVRRYLKESEASESLVRAKNQELRRMYALQTDTIIQLQSELAEFKYDQTAAKTKAWDQSTDG
jgi:chromosome segregation ATPase